MNDHFKRFQSLASRSSVIAYHESINHEISTLIIYISTSANTKRVVTFIQATKSVDIKTKEPNTDADLNYGDPNSRFLLNIITDQQ